MGTNSGKSKFARVSALAAFLLLAATSSPAAPTRPWKVFLLFGQSNMHGGSTSDAEDRKTNPRVKVLSYDNCTQNGRKYNQWATAAPALHSCGTGVGLGDWFGKVLADSLPEDTIALIPCAVSGVDISFFSKGVTSSRRKDFSIPPDNHWTGAYPWMLERLKLAQEKGQIAGILLHQGEADWTDTARTRWPGRVAKIVGDLKEDLKFPDVPVLIGELRQDSKACCGAHNPYVATAAKTVPNGWVVSSKGLEPGGDAYHLTSPGNREFGKRYATAMLQALPKSSVDRGRGGVVPTWNLVQGSDRSWLRFSSPQDWIQVGTPDGRWISQGFGDQIAIPHHHGLLLIRVRNGNDHRSWLLPSIF
ncbi:MAG TPA: sialate O-acetylesterase [Fibrobacteria bacterium]|nr:sialate O-acetylesterase [Fibrobacteria bacterium]HOX52792.1 sialate O-acetylesterase [Fibrobacteria bacterium]